MPSVAGMDTYASHDPHLTPLPLELPVPERVPAWLDEIARRQSGVVTIRQLRRGGVSDDTRRRLIREGAWSRVTPHVVVLAPHSARRQSVVVALLHAGGRAVVTGLTALELADAAGVRHGADIHVLVPRRRTATPRSHGLTRAQGSSSRTRSASMCVGETPIPSRTYASIEP